MFVIKQISFSNILDFFYLDSYFYSIEKNLFVYRTFVSQFLFYWFIFDENIYGSLNLKEWKKIIERCVFQRFSFFTNFSFYDFLIWCLNFDRKFRINKHFTRKLSYLFIFLIDLTKKIFANVFFFIRSVQLKWCEFNRFYG